MMKYIKAFAIVIALFSCTSLCHAQYRAKGNIGLKVGVNHTEIQGLSKILISEDYYSGYEINTQMQFSPTACLFFNYHNERAHIGIEPQLLYYRLATALKYSDVHDLNYDIKFNYHYVGFALYFKVYAVAGLNFTLGSKVGFNVTPNNLYYSSNQEDTKFDKYHYETVKETENYLRNKIQGKNDIAIGGGLSYEFPFGLSIDALYHYSLCDLTETLPNNFSWIDTKNLTHQFEIKIGYAFKVTYK